MRGCVDRVVEALQSVLSVLSSHCDAQAPGAGTGGLAAGDQDEGCVRRSALEDDLQLWREVLIPGDEQLSTDELLTRLLQIEIAATTLGDEVSTGATLPVELAQLSAQTVNHFARYSTTGDDKLGGMSVNRFGGFLKRSWRVNDWTWGRVDAASHLCRVVLQPARIRRTAELSGYLPPHTPATSAEAAAIARQAAAESVGEIIDRFLPELRDDPRILRLRDQAVCELTPVLDRATPAQDLAATLPALADLFAWALHLHIVPSELPALAGAVRADGVEGANGRSYGEVFIKEHEMLLTRLDNHARGASADLAAQDRIAALEVFDRAGIGRELLRHEGASDQMIRTATTAAAVAATVVDSAQSGLTAIKPLTRALRGAALLPFWVVTGLTGKGMLGRSFSLLALASGAVLLALPLLGVLPDALAGPAAALGLSAVLAAFAIGALRSGTMLHGLVLLTPVVPLIVFAVNRARDGGTTDRATTWGVSTLLVVLALSAGLMVLGSLPATTGSVWSALDHLADRQNIHPVQSGAGLRRELAQGRRLLGLGRALVTLVSRVVVAVAVVGLMVWLSYEGWDAAVHFATEARAWLMGAACLAAAAGATVAYVLGRQLQVLTFKHVLDRHPPPPRPGSDPVTARDASGPGVQEQWKFLPLAHPAGSSAGWAVLYGAGYLVLAAVLGTRGESMDSAWMRSFIATAVVLGVLLILVVPVWLPLWAMRRIVDSEVRRALSGAHARVRAGGRERHDRAQGGLPLLRAGARGWVATAAATVRHHPVQADRSRADPRGARVCRGARTGPHPARVKVSAGLVRRPAEVAGSRSARRRLHPWCVLEAGSVRRV